MCKVAMILSMKLMDKVKVRRSSEGATETCSMNDI